MVHTLVLTKLEHCGIRGVAYDWIKSYLCERKKYLRVNSCNSDAMNVVPHTSQCLYVVCRMGLF